MIYLALQLGRLFVVLKWIQDHQLRQYHERLLRLKGLVFNSLKKVPKNMANPEIYVYIVIRMLFHETHWLFYILDVLFLRKPSFLESHFSVRRNRATR